MREIAHNQKNIDPIKPSKEEKRKDEQWVAKQKTNSKLQAFTPSTAEAEAALETQGHPGLHPELKVSPRYMRFYLKKQTTTKIPWEAKPGRSL